MMEEGFSLSREWTARWIWHPHAPVKNAWVLLRCEFVMGDVENARLFISADTRYRAWVNGALLGDGPPQSQPYHQFYDEREIALYIQKGQNCLAVLVHHQGVQDAARGGLLAEVVDGNGNVCCVTDSGWRCMIGPWTQNSCFTPMNRIGPFQEHVDLRKMPSGWQQVGFADAGWSSAIEIHSRGNSCPPLVVPWCRMIPRDIRFLDEQTVYAKALQCEEECLDLAARRAPNDASLSLSQAGRPVAWSTITDGENLLGEEGETRLACSDRHRDRVTDGRYDPCITLDFGRVITGYVELDVEAPAGAMIEIGYAERLVDGRFNNALECPFADRVVFADGPNCFRPFVWRAFRYVRLRLKQCEVPLRVRAVRAIALRYPYAMRGAFKGTARLEGIFEMSRNTIELCSIESLMDTPYREQAQWLGDVSAVTIPAIYACFGDCTLPGKFLRQAAMNTRPTGLLANISNVASTDWQHDIPDYSLWWVIALWHHYQYSGEARYLHTFYPEMQRIMRTHLERIGPDGLLGPLFGWVFIDWAPVDVDGSCAPYNALFAGACDAAASIAAFKQDAWAADTYAAAAAGVRSAFTEAFLDPVSGVVADARKDGQRSSCCSEHGNAAAIAFGCVDTITADRIIDIVFDRNVVQTSEAQPFFMVVVLDALRRRGRLDLAVRLIDERWGRRMLDLGRQSCTEEWFENGSWRSGDWQGFQRTHSHAWSACPADFLITGLAGIEIVEPGCKVLRIRPYEAAFPYAIVYPTPSGDVSIRWDGQSAQIDLPEGVLQL